LHPANATRMRGCRYEATAAGRNAELITEQDGHNRVRRHQARPALNKESDQNRRKASARWDITVVANAEQHVAQRQVAVHVAAKDEGPKQAGAT
jgi:hypothetical protein